MAIDIAVVLVELSSRGDLNYLRLGEPSWASRVVVEPSLGLLSLCGVVSWVPILIKSQG
jgi:hypothetical protein